MQGYQANYYDILLDLKVHKRIFVKYSTSENQQDMQVAKETNDEITKINYRLTALEECFYEMKKEYDDLEEKIIDETTDLNKEGV